ncbi:MAG: quinone oxidoreductase [Phenylobacterium sp.]|jgi:NADPH2:quinone reductase|uniref:quinone oxidoreductase family protein n=1 Tax=Phenylobacterium sp. TaxID=1871053 RepID=UPI0025DAE5BD|nr:quinone oxidoreductase [Phenylobacterium sp.]MCA3716430.1 quinone oxidoreductase [Phenylobacterium sp.]MCA3726476.1 quinone oxidoreductase [Phenylobacterium sp.]MCA3733257.1 quinone oxidoreductase [Phenylobacterium sp.]MCA3737383.1 quinone oxidoreductase [Phenylobacterium sp.]MCA3739754.1 quinone oxidoreductase [Phenylobacterium sp.]
MRAIRLSATGGPEVLDLVDLPDPEPGPGQLLVRQSAIGVNYIDTYHRSGLYPLRLPSGLGMEGAGDVVAAGEGVERFAPGDRVAFASGPIGAYADLHLVDAARAVRIPEGVDERTAAAALLKGMTAEFLLLRCRPVQPGEPVLIHAAAGGVGQIMVQWARALGAEVIATAGSAAKADRARALGAHHVILYGEQDVAAEVRRITGGAGVTAAYDSVGASTFEGTLGSLARRGTFVSFGNASGPPPAVEPGRLMRMGSLFFTRPTLGDYIATTPELDASAAAVFGRIAAGEISIEIGQTFPLSQAKAAHEALEARQTVGSTLLIP